MPGSVQGARPSITRALHPRSIVMSEAGELAAKLEAEGEKMSAFFAGLALEQWNAEVYTEGSVWTVRSILAHLMTAERAFVKLFENIRQGGPGVSEDFVIDRYNAR